MEAGSGRSRLSQGETPLAAFAVAFFVVAVSRVAPRCKYEVQYTLPKLKKHDISCGRVRVVN